MIVDLLKRQRRGVGAVLALLLTAVGVQSTYLAPKAHALGAGTACVFYYPWQVDLAELGHVAWAFSIPGSSNRDYGSADGGFGPGTAQYAFDTPHSEAVWVSQGTFSRLTADFASFGYTKYVCQNSATSAVGAAQNFAFQDHNIRLHISMPK